MNISLNRDWISFLNSSSYDLSTHNYFTTLQNDFCDVIIPEKKTLIYKFGKVSRKFISFFQKSETKATALLTYWALETVLFGAIMIAAANIYSFLAALFLYSYGTYAIFSAINTFAK